jgi:hypothetical protein
LKNARQWHEGQGNWFARRVRSLARHYQLFGNLPRERRGGIRLARSWLHDEQVKLRALEYLRSVPAGKVTSAKFHKYINSSLFPELDIKPKKPLSIRTARRWLIKLGWTYTLVKKGVYMGGHEREDVVHFRNHEFLPAMLRFEERMVHYKYYEDKGPDLVTPPTVRHVAISWSGHVHHVRGPPGIYPPVGWILADRVNGSMMDPAFLETSCQVRLEACWMPTWGLLDSSCSHSNN